MTKITLEIPFDEALKWYTSEDSFRRNIAITLYSEEELQKGLNKNSLPNSWKEYYDSRPSDYQKWLDKKLDKFESRKSMYLFALRELRNCYRQGWKPKRNSKTFMYRIIKIDVPYYLIEEREEREDEEFILSFQSYELAEKFLKNFEDLLKMIDNDN